MMSVTRQERNPAAQNIAQYSATSVLLPLFSVARSRPRYLLHT